MAYDRVPDLDSLRLLMVIAECGSLSRAAARHGISQPAATARLQSMERLVGAALVTRTPRGSHLTPAGVLLVGWARDVLDAADVLDAGLASLRRDRSARLHVAASMTVAEFLLPGWLVTLAREHPDGHVSLAAMNSAQVETAVRSGAAGLGFVEGPDLPQGLAGATVARDRLVLVVPPGHPWAGRRRGVDAAELAATRLVTRELHSGTRDALARALMVALRASIDPTASDTALDIAPDTAEIPEPVAEADPLLELSTSTAVRAAVAAGAGPAVLSALAVGPDVDAGRLIEVPVRGVDLTRELRAVWPAAQPMRGLAADLLAIASRG